MIVAARAGPVTAAGSLLPNWLRYATMVTGISWSDEIFIIRKVHISRLAVSSPGFFNAFMARSPAGVAALPRPSIFAIIFTAICFLAGWPFSRCGKRKSRTGSIFPASQSTRPEVWPICKIPFQKVMIPSMVIPKETASAAPFKAPVVT